MPERVPVRLDNEHYIDIARTMVRNYDPSKPSAVVYDHIPLDGAAFNIFHFDTSFARQMKDVTADLDTEPDVYLLTANSCIPVADSILGFYDALGRQAPEMTYVEASRTHAYNAQSLAPEDQQAHEEEIERLRPYVEDAQRICITDEFIHQGTSLRYALSLIRSINPDVPVTAIRGLWYHDAAHTGGVDKQNLTSAHQAFMHTLGRQAAVLAYGMY